MTLRPGMYDASAPVWRGVIRDDGAPFLHCVGHRHPDRDAARKCAREALAQYKDSRTVPDGWFAYRYGD